MLRTDVPLNDLTNIDKIEREKWDLAHLDLDYTDIESQIRNPFDHVTEYDIVHPDEHLLSLMMNPDYFGWTCKILFNMDLLPVQVAILREMWYAPFPMLICSRGFGKTTLLGLYAVLRALFLQGRKIVITGAGFRQSKMVFAVCEKLWAESPMLQDMCGYQYDARRQGPHHNSDVWSMNIGESIISALPIGSGEKIRGMRANDILADEFSSMQVQIFEEVIAGFGVVSSDPIDKVKQLKRIKNLKKKGTWTQQAQEDFENSGISNQIVISGTASFSFNHFCKYWKKNRNIIRAGNDPDAKKRLGVDKSSNAKNYCIFRFPVDLVEEGFMDKEQVQRSRENQHNGIFMNEFGACFSDDTAGFYKRSLIEACVTNKPVMTPSGPVQFSARITGDRNKKYIYAVDPAAMQDNFAVTILEEHADHARVVYCWTTQDEIYQKKKKQIEGVRRKHIKDDLEGDFYSYCARKIRNLMITFPCKHIAIDSGGGGEMVYQALNNTKNMFPGESPLLELNEESPLWDQKKRETDDLPGMHIVEMVHASSTDYTSGAHHGLKFDLEKRQILFPVYDAIEVVTIGHFDDSDSTEDNLEDCLLEIEEMKNEMASIQVTPTPSGREHWDTPQIKEMGSPTGRLKKDRFSALVMANYAAHRFRLTPTMDDYVPVGGFASNFNKRNQFATGGPLYVGPAWINKEVVSTEMYGIVLKD